MSLQHKPHLTAIARHAFGALYRYMLPMRALIESRTATGNVFIGGVRDAQPVPGSPLLLDGRLLAEPSWPTVAKRNSNRVVLDFDHLPWFAPQNGSSAQPLPAVVRDAIDRQLAAADAVSVSTDALRCAFVKHGHDAVVLPHNLDPRDWSVQPRRAARGRSRIGWYGGCYNTADASRLCERVVRALIDHVDFVVFDSVPSGLTDVADRIETTMPAPLAFFPTLLAALDLDIVLTPLARDTGDEYASNLPLLQAGILGYPVIATDIEPYRHLPVTRLPNAPAAWIAAIRDRMHEPAMLREEGRILRSAVHAQFVARDWAQHYFELWTGVDKPLVDV